VLSGFYIKFEPLVKRKTNQFYPVK